MEKEQAAAAVRAFLAALDVDVSARGMERTPERVAEMYGYLFGGLGRDAAAVLGATFETGATGLVAVQRIPFSSLCEHHLVPFYGTVDIVYQPTAGRIAGFSKFGEAVDIAAHRPQLQERLTQDIADAVRRGLGASGVLVLCRATQLCMTLREGGSYGTETTTSATLGTFESDKLLAQQAWNLLLPIVTSHSKAFPLGEGGARQGDGKGGEGTT